MILAIDPGNEKSAYVVLEDDLKPGEFGKVSCAHVRDIVIPTLVDLYPGITLAIEMVASYGMPVGREVFETCFWAGMFWQAANVKDKRLIYRMDEKLNLCHDSRAKDANIRQALIDRFAYCEAQLYLVECEFCGIKALVKERSPQAAAHTAFGRKTALWVKEDGR